MARYLAPADTSGISLICGDFPVVDGIVEVPDDLGEGDISGLGANGFRLAPADAAPKKAAPPPPQVAEPAAE